MKNNVRTKIYNWLMENKFLSRIMYYKRGNDKGQMSYPRFGYSEKQIEAGKNFADGLKDIKWE